MRCGFGCFSGGWLCRASRLKPLLQERLPRRVGVLRIEYAYWLVATFFALTAWINLRQRRWVQTGFWSVLALLFASGDLILAAAKSGNHGPGQFAGLGVLLLALLAPRMKRE